MASQIPRNRRRIQVQEKDLVPGGAGEAVPGNSFKQHHLHLTARKIRPHRRAS
jgi:hypothetical protein